MTIKTLNYNGGLDKPKTNYLWQNQEEGDRGFIRCLLLFTVHNNKKISHPSPQQK